MERYGILVDYEYCTGCHSCEVACKEEHQFPQGKWGIQLAQISPWEIVPDKWQYSFIPIPTEMCDLCEARVAQGKEPTCVHHCQAQVMKFGKVEDLAIEMKDKSHTVFFAPR